MRVHLAVLVLAAAAACKMQDASTPAPGVTGATGPSAQEAQAVPTPTTARPDNCTVDAMAKDMATLIDAANHGQSVVATDGCSLFDGPLLVRGWPRTQEVVKGKMLSGGECTSIMHLDQGNVEFGRQDGRLVVVRFKNLTDAAVVAQEEAAGAVLEQSLIKAARCPIPERRLRSEQDASVAVTYTVAAVALQKLLTDGTPPEADVTQTMTRVCQLHAKETLPKLDPPAPFAAGARLMAGSFKVFKSAARTAKASDPALNAVQDAATKVLKDAPTTNLDGVCAMWSMAKGVQEGLAKAPKGNKKPATAKAPAKKKTRK